MEEFLNGFSVTRSQWTMLDAILRSLRAQSELANCGVPCITFKQVAQFFEPMTPDSPRHHGGYTVTRSEGQGYFTMIGSRKKIGLKVFCEELHTNGLLLCDNGYEFVVDYTHAVFVSYRLPDGIRRVIKLDGLEADPVVVKFGGKKFAPQVAN